MPLNRGEKGTDERRPCRSALWFWHVDSQRVHLFYFIDKHTRKEVFPHYYDQDTYEALDENNNVIEDYEAYFREEITFNLGKVMASKLNR